MLMDKNPCNALKSYINNYSQMMMWMMSDYFNPPHIGIRNSVIYGLVYSAPLATPAKQNNIWGWWHIRFHEDFN